jgi:IQ calmodulin-binding motif
MIARKAYKREVEEQRLREKQKLSQMLNSLQTQIKTCFNQVENQFDASAIKIQGAVRKMLARKRFRLALYKLMLLKNIIENKVHKEKMQMLYAFEQMIINTEDEND